MQLYIHNYSGWKYDMLTLLAPLYIYFPGQMRQSQQKSKQIKPKLALASGNDMLSETSAEQLIVF